MTDVDKLVEKIGDIIDAKLTEKLEPIITVQKQLGGDIAALRKGQEQQGGDIAALKAGQKKQDRTLSGVQKDIKLVLKYHDEMHIRLRSRVEALEKGVTKN